MPIVNGTYVPDTIPENFTDQSVTGIAPSRRDFSDSKTAQLNYIMKQQEQAYNLELWNLQNQYNTPAAQMARYQDAGLNPYLIYSKDNMASSPAAASASTFRSQGTYSRNMNVAMNAIGQIMNIVKSARDTYDYMKYGSETSAWNRNLTMQRSQAEALQNYWNSYLLGLPSPDSIPGSPKQQMNQYQIDSARANFERLQAIVSLIPEQEARQKALRQLDEKRGEIMNGQYDFILHGFDTGNETLNSFLRMFMMFGMSSLF